MVEFDKIAKIVMLKINYSYLISRRTQANYALVNRFCCPSRFSAAPRLEQAGSASSDALGVGQEVQLQMLGHMGLLLEQQPSRLSQEKIGCTCRVSKTKTKMIQCKILNLQSKVQQQSSVCDKTDCSMISESQ